MAQVTIYLDDAAERRVRAAARRSKVSVSRWLAELVESRVRTEWPPKVRKLAGAWPDFPDLKEIRSLTDRASKRNLPTSPTSLSTRTPNPRHFPYRKYTLGQKTLNRQP